MLFDKVEAAAYLKVCPDTIMKELHKGSLIGFKVGGQWRFDQRDMDAYIDGKRQDAENKVRRMAGNTRCAKPARRQNLPSGIVPVWKPGMIVTANGVTGGGV
jgi:excisionase family DNA binding protein